MSRVSLPSILVTVLLAACDATSAQPAAPPAQVDGSMPSRDGDLVVPAKADASFVDASGSESSIHDGSQQDAPTSPDAGDASSSTECNGCDAGQPSLAPENTPLCRPYNILSDPSFEEGPSTFGPPWKKEGDVGLGIADGSSYRGPRCVQIRAGSNWNAITQRVAVRPGRDYTLSFAIQTSTADFGLGYMGLRTTSGEIIQEMTFSAQAAYRELSVQLNARQNTLVDVFVGTWAHSAGTWMRVDAASFAPTGMCDTPRVCSSATNCQSN